MRLHEVRDDYRNGRLVIVEPQSSNECIEVLYVPSRQKLVEAAIDFNDADAHRVKLLEIDKLSGRLTIFPTNTLAGNRDFLKPKYEQVERITLSGGQLIFSHTADSVSSRLRFKQSLTFGPTEPLYEEVKESEVAEYSPSEEDIVMMLESLPSGFTKDYDYGLGLAKEYRFMVNAIQELSDCTEIFISPVQETMADEEQKIFYVSTDDFDVMRKSLNNTTSLSRSAARSVKDVETYNFLANRIGRAVKPISVGRHPLRKLFTNVIQNDPQELTDVEQDQVLGVMTKNVKSLAKARPDKLTSLRNDIDLVNLEMLIERYEKMIAARHNENIWQEFLNQNPFILSLAFGYPIIKVRDRASVGGRKLSGTGEKVTDFLVKNSMTNNTAIVEIKTPQTGLLNKLPYRDGVLVPSSKLSGAINQALDQKYQFQRAIAQIKESSGIHDIASYSVNCCLIIGTMPDDEEQRKSFELFRGNSKDVEIVTFDELLQKSRDLRKFLTGPEMMGREAALPVEPPF